MFKKGLKIGLMMALPVLSTGTQAAIDWVFNNATGSYSSGGVNLSVTAWAASGGGSTLENVTDRLRYYSGSGLGIDRSGESNPQHAIDNSGPDEFLVFNFNTAVSLTGYQFGWASEDWDSTVLAWDTDGSVGGAPTLSGETIGNLTTNGWDAIGHYWDGNSYTKSISAQTQAVGSEIYSSRWIIGARLSDVAASNFGSNNRCCSDFFKLKSITGVKTPDTPPGTGVPAPAPLALMGLGLLLLRRKFQS